MGDVGYKKPPKHGMIKPGEVRNPLGGRSHNPELRAVKRLTAAELADIGSLLLSKNIDGLRQILEEAKDSWSEHSTLKVWIASVAVKAIQKGDPHALDILLNRFVGRTAEKIQLTGDDGGPVKHLVGQMTSEEKAAELARLRKMREDAGND